MKHTRISNCLKMPNVIIDDTILTYASKCVAATLYAYRNTLNYCRLGLAKLARYSGCSVATVRKALTQLTERGYISTYRNYAWCTQRSRMIFRKDAIICRVSTHTNFTFIPRATLQMGMRKSSFSIYLYICRTAGNTGRAFPSLRKIADTLLMGTSTVCRGLKELTDLTLLHREHCIKRDGCHACNSYFLIRNVSKKATAKVVPVIRVVRTTPSAPVTVQPVRISARTLHHRPIKRTACNLQIIFSDFSIIHPP